MKEAYIPLSEENEFKVPTFIQVCKAHSKKKKPIGIASYVVLSRTDDYDAILDYATQYNKKYNVSCMGSDLEETIKLALTHSDFYFIKNKQDTVIGMFQLTVEKCSLRGTEYDDMPILTIPNVMLMEDSPTNLDILCTMSSEILLMLKERYFPNTMFVNFCFCGSAYSNILYFNFLLTYAVWGDRYYDAESCNLFCHIADVKRMKNIVHYLDRRPTPEDIANYKKDMKAFLKKINLELRPVVKEGTARLDGLFIMRDICKKHSFETFTVPVRKLKGMKYGLVNDEANKICRAGKQSVPIFIDEKFNIIWGNDLYEFMLAKDITTADCVLVDDVVLREMQQGYLCAVITDMVNKPLKEIVGKFTLDMLTEADRETISDENLLYEMLKDTNVTDKYKSTDIPGIKQLTRDFIAYIKEGKKSDMLTIIDKFADCNFNGYFDAKISTVDPV